MKGSNPAEMPGSAADAFEFVIISRDEAKNFWLGMSAYALARSDEVIG
jgi:hypothetical protein